MGKAAKRRAIADKVADDIVRLRKDIADRRKHLDRAKARSLAKPHRCALTCGWFDAWSRHAPQIARAEGALARALKRLPEAITKAEDAATRDRLRASRCAAIGVRNIGLMRRLDALRAAAPSLQQRWDAERRSEEGRLRKIKKRLEARTRKDVTARPDWMRKPLALPPPVRQPDLSLPDVVVDAPPPREGLVPGTYRLVDPERLRINLLDEELLPSSWTARHVGKRLIEAHDVLRRLPSSVWPKGYGVTWPAYAHDAGELAIQAGAYTLEIGRNVILKTASADEVARMNEAMDWIWQYLAGCNAWRCAR